MIGADLQSIFGGFLKLALVPARVATKIFGMLSEASAEVGEWFLRQNHDETQ
ncbi:MAG: hypothetical protein ABSA59_24055 [Terriglobia bacterium]